MRFESQAEAWHLGEVYLRQQAAALSPAALRLHHQARERAERARRRQRDLSTPSAVRALEMARRHHLRALREPATKG